MAVLSALLATAALLLTILTVILAPAYVVGRVRRGLREERDSLLTAVIQLKQERARAAGTIATAVRRGTIKPQPEPEDDDLDDDEDEEDAELPPALLGLAQSLGIDPEKVMAGDPAELAKVQAALSKAGASAPSGAPAPGGVVYL